MKRKHIVVIWKLIHQVPNSIWFLICGGLIVSLILLGFTFFISINILFEKVPAYGGVLREGFYQSIETLNPLIADKNSEKTLINLIYDSLVRPDLKGGYEYELAKSIKKLEQGLSYEIELKDAYWSDGSKITSDDVVMTFELIKNFASNELAEIVKNIKVEKIDNSKVKISLPVKDNYFIQKLSFIKILPSKIWVKFKPSEWKDKEEELIKVSSGPFVFSKKYKEKGVYIYEFEKNKYYYPAPYLDKVIIKVYPDLYGAYKALKMKEIDALGGIKLSYYVSISPRYFNTYKIILPRVISIFFNSEKLKSFEKINKLKTAINREEITKEVFETFGEPSYGIFSDSILKIYNIKPELPIPSKNRENLDFSDITIIVPDNIYFQKIANYLQQNFKFGIKTMPIEVINNSIIPNKDYDAILYGVSYNLLPDLGFLFAKNSVLNLTNYSDLDIQKIIQDLETGKEENFVENLKKLYEEINKKQPIIFLVNNYYPYIVSKKIKNLNIIYLNDASERFVKIENWYIKEKLKW